MQIRTSSGTNREDLERARELAERYEASHTRRGRPMTQRSREAGRGHHQQGLYSYEVDKEAATFGWEPDEERLAYARVGIDMPFNPTASSIYANHRRLWRGRRQIRPLLEAHDQGFQTC